MQTNGHTKTATQQPFRFPGESPKASQPIVQVQQQAAKAQSQAKAQLELARQQNQIAAERAMNGVTVAVSALPIVKAVVGDPNANLAQHTRVILERDVDCVSDTIEFIIEDLD